MFHHKGINIIFMPLLFVLVLVCMEYHIQFVSGEIRCLEKERDALLMFKQGLIDDSGDLASWGSEDEKKDCCSWQGVICSNTTGHVTGLGFPRLKLRGEISSALLELSHMDYLDLSFNDFGGNRIPEFIGSIERLEYLSLRNSNFSGIVPPQLGNLTNLRTLELGYNSLWSDNLNWLSHLSLLAQLNLDSSNISDANWQHQVLKLHSLQHLSLSKCMLTDVTSSPSLFVNSSLTSLSELDLSYNELTSSTFHWLFNISTSLVRLRLTKNQLDGPIPNAFQNLLLLEYLALSDNKLTGPLLESIGQLSKLLFLDVSFNFLEGTIAEANFMNLNSLRFLDLSFNSLTFNLSPNWIPPFHLGIIALARCKMGPSFPKWLQTQIGFIHLDISSAAISDELPEWLWNTPPSYLNLSHNQISGTIPNILPNVIEEIDVSSNNISGPVPLLHPRVVVLHLSQNMFSGPISSICTDSDSKLLVLDLSNNQLTGALPNCWENMTRLRILNLNNNNFSGEIPHTFGFLASLVTLHLRGNNFSGEFPSTLKNCTLLQLIDIGENKLTGDISSWLGGDYPSMAYLSLRQNRFYGGIPQEICYLTEIQLLDLSENYISGKIPECFNNFTSLIDKSETTTSTYLLLVGIERNISQYIDYALVQWKGKASEYRNTLGLLKLIDLSSNRLVGDIPRAFSSLRALISLNLSRNNLTGSIDPNIGQMEMLEILDLSRNQLSSEIPDGLAQVHSLAVLDLSNNNLSGKIPLGTQLQSFNASVYARNELCGLPLMSCPSDSLNPSDNNQEEDGDTSDKDFWFLRASFFQGPWISVILGFIVGFWGIVGSLLLNKSWRDAYFNFWDDIGDWLYVTVVIFMRKFKRN